MIPVFRPSMGEEEISAVADVIRSGWIGLGPKVTEFEDRFGNYVNAKCSVALNSCTAALHLALEVSGIGEGDEVLVPSLTFVSTAHVIQYVGATPVFCDIDPATLCVSVEDLKSRITPRTKAMIPVHYGGHPCEMDELLEIGKKEGITVIEDAAHACGAEYNGRKIGSLGDATCFSFHAVKNLATGDGGMITTRNEGDKEKLHCSRWLGIDKATWKRSGTKGYNWYYEIAVLGHKYHMNDIAAAIGLIQLKKLDSLNARRRDVVAQYNEAFRDVDWIEIPVEKPYVRSAHHNYVIRTLYRNELNLYLKEKEIASGVHYMPLHLQPYYKAKCEANLPVVEKTWKRLLTLPLYPDLTDVEVDYIIDCVRKFR
jgi:perosamine synthetase